MDAIRHWLYIGKYQDTLDPQRLARQGIGAVLQLAEAVSYPDISALYLPVEDGEPLSDHLLRRGIDFVLAEKQAGKTVLIACGAGISRSAAFAVAVLKESEALSLKEAVRSVKQHRPVCLPHPALWRSLCGYYQEPVSFREMENCASS